MLMVKDDYVFGNQKLEWAYRLDHLVSEPKLTNEGIKIQVKVIFWMSVYFQISFLTKISFQEYREKYF
jgi:hypothetical protein